MKKLCVFTLYDEKGASSRYRILMYKTELEKHFETVPNKAQYTNEIEGINTKMAGIRQQNIELREELRSLETLKFNLDIIYEKEPERRAEDEPTEQQLTERKKHRTDDFDIDF